jgi:hypothetical protein
MSRAVSIASGATVLLLSTVRADCVRAEIKLPVPAPPAPNVVVPIVPLINPPVPAPESGQSKSPAQSPDPRCAGLTDEQRRQTPGCS